MTQDPCYGNMFPSVNAPRSGVPLRGAVFSLKLFRAGGMAVVDHETDVDMDAWHKCRACPDFDHCYKLSMAKLELETGVMQN